MAPSLVACDDNDTVLRTLVYSKAEACKTTFLFLSFFLFFSFLFFSFLPLSLLSFFTVRTTSTPLSFIRAYVRRVTKEPQP